MTQVTDREILQEMLERPIGSPRLQAEIEANLPRLQRESLKPTWEMREAAQRASKKWLPAGKKPTRTPEIKAAEEAFYAKQIDIEDAVEAAGGSRGGTAA